MSIDLDAIGKRHDGTDSTGDVYALIRHVERLQREIVTLQSTVQSLLDQQPEPLTREAIAEALYRYDYSDARYVNQWSLVNPSARQQYYEMADAVIALKPSDE